MLGRLIWVIFGEITVGMSNIPIEAGKFYHFYNRTNNNELLFREEKNYSYFLKLMGKYILPVADIYAYCLLPDHFHIVGRIKEEHELPDKYRMQPYRAFSHLFNAYTKAYNRMYNRYGSLFQKNFKRIEIKDERYLQNLIIYIDTNADHHGIPYTGVYLYSSLLDNIGIRNGLTDRKAVIELFEELKNYVYMIKTKKNMIHMSQDLLFE